MIRLKALNFIGLIIIFNFICVNNAELYYSIFPQCDIYCQGELLKTIQLVKPTPDSKTFVDKPLRKSVNETLADFNAFMATANHTPTDEAVRDFVEAAFYDVGDEFIPWDPVDWTATPKAFEAIADAAYKEWAHELNDVWKQLGRKLNDSVWDNQEMFSIIPVPNPVIVPGGRFVEFYYWDSYWIVRGLLYSEMHQTVKGMLENFLSIVDNIGHIPNGGRVYYAERSQPPMLIPMIKSYYEFTNDVEFIQNNIATMEKEFGYWLNNHAVELNGYTLYKYGDFSKGPRPESYKEDYETAAHLSDEVDKENLYSELKAAAESGMDFSTRWYIDENGGNTGELRNTKCREIIPVELNAFLYWNAITLVEFYRLVGNISKAAEYEFFADQLKTAIQEVLWNEEAGAWLDYDLINNKSRNFFTPTNLSPLWVKAYDITDITLAPKILQYIANVGVDQYPGGVPNTITADNQQWDFPNVWPPMQYMLIMGLDGLANDEAKALAYKWADRWVLTNYMAYGEEKHMYEKYDCRVLGGHGDGGEYGVQLGFGWTNGVILELLVKYADRLPASAASNLNIWPIKVFAGTIILLFTKMIRRIVG